MEEPAQHAGGRLSAAAHRQPPTRPQQHGAHNPAHGCASSGDPQGDEEHIPGSGNALESTQRHPKVTKAIASCSHWLWSDPSV